MTGGIEVTADDVIARWIAGELDSADLVAALDQLDDPLSRLLAAAAAEQPALSVSQAISLEARILASLVPVPAVGRRRTGMLTLAACLLAAIGAVLTLVIPQRPAAHVNGTRIIVRAVSFQTVTEGRTVTFQLQLYKSKEIEGARKPAP